MVFIRIKVKGYLKNITDNEILEFEENGIRNKNKIIYSSDNIKNTVKINASEVILIREGNDFVNTFVFNKVDSSCNYFLKENGYDVDIDITTIKVDVTDIYVYIRYLIIDSNCEYEYKIEMSDINEYKK